MTVCVNTGLVCKLLLPYYHRALQSAVKIRIILILGTDSTSRLVP